MEAACVHAGKQDGPMTDAGFKKPAKSAVFR
jgi:hypothetical protein